VNDAHTRTPRVSVDPNVVIEQRGSFVVNVFARGTDTDPERPEFLDFDKKYLDFSRTGDVGRAAIDEALEAALKETFATLYEGMFEGALIRCDFFVVDGKVLLNEINPIPGSMANYLFDDFQACIADLLGHLPPQRRPRVEYRYIHSIHAAKGK